MVGFGTIGQCLLPMLLGALAIEPERVQVLDGDDHRSAVRAWTERGIGYAVRRVERHNLGEIMRGSRPPRRCARQRLGGHRLGGPRRLVPGRGRRLRGLLHRALGGRGLGPGPASEGAHRVRLSPERTPPRRRALGSGGAERGGLPRGQPRAREPLREGGALRPRARARPGGRSARGTPRAGLRSRSVPAPGSSTSRSATPRSPGTPSGPGSSSTPGAYPAFWRRRACRWRSAGGPTRGPCRRVRCAIRTVRTTRFYLPRAAARAWVRSWVPLGGQIDGLALPHSESITLSDYLTAYRDGVAHYRPTVVFSYQPCDAAFSSLHESVMRDWRRPVRSGSSTTTSWRGATSWGSC